MFFIGTLETKLESHSKAQYPWDGFSYRIISLNSCMRRKIEITEPISNLEKANFNINKSINQLIYELILTLRSTGFPLLSLLGSIL